MSLSLHPHIHGRLTAFDSRRARFRWLKSLAAAMIALLVSICVVALCDYWMAPSNLVRWSLTSSAYTVALLCFVITSPVGRMLSRRDPSAELVKSAEWLESKLPRLRHFLVAAVELGDGNASERNPHYSSSADFRDELQRRVAGSLAQIRTHEVLPWNTLRSWMISGATAASLLVLPLLLFPNSFISSFLWRALLPNANVARPAATMVYWVEPQTVQSTVPSNESIEISARVVGVRPENVFVSLTTEERSTLLEMRRSAESTAGELYRAIIPVEDAALSLKILAGDGESKVVKLQPTARPSIDEYQIEYQLPEYARSPNRTSVTDHGNLVALEGSVATVKMHATAPLSNISVVYRPSDNTETSDLPFTRLAMDSFHVQVPIDRDGRYRWQLRGSDTGFETPFAPWFKIQSITDLPPRVQLFISAGHNGLYDAKEIVALSGEIRDELEVDQTYLEYSINGLPWVTGPDLTSGMSSESNSEAFQIHATARLDWDLAPLSLKDGDLARARLVAVDRNSQRTASQPIQFMITQLDFSVDRYPLLTAKSDLLQKLMTWRSALDPPTAQLASNDVFDFLLPLLSEEMNRPDAMELEAISQAIFVLGTLRHDSAPFTESENAIREQVVKAARHFLARTINEGCARDIEKLDQHISRIADGVMDREIAWLERQVQLAHEYYDASTVLIESTSVGLTQSMINNCDNLARQLKDLQQRMDLQLDQEIKREGLRDELKYQKDQLGYRISNPHLEGSIPNLCIESIVELNRISQSNAVRLNDLAKNIRKRDELRAKMLDATDASVISELELQLIESMERIGEQCATIVAIQAAELVSHKAQKEFSVTRVSDSHLIAQVFEVSLPKTIGDSVKAKVYELSYRDTLIKSVQTLDVGNDVLDLLDDLQQLARRERWETSQLELRLGHPMRWEYLQKGFDLAVLEMQQLATLRELANIVNTIRYGEISRSASEQISQRRWDKNRKTSAADDLDQMLVQFREPVLELQKIMEQAREELRKLLPEEYAGEESLASAAQNEAQESENAAFRQLTEQSPAEALKTLEEELKRDANMRSSLDKISEEIAIDAMEQLRLAAKQEEQLALQLEHNDPVLREKKRTAIARMTDLANRAQEVLRHPLEQARATASRGAAGDVAKALEKPQEALRNATTAAQSVGEQMSMDAIKAAAKQVAEALDEAERGLASADEQIDSLEENEIEKRPQDRQRTKEQMEALQRRTQDNAVRDMAQRQKRWSDMVQQRNRDIERTGRELNNAQKNLEKAQAELAQHPDEEWREQQTRDAANQVRLSEQAMAGLSQSLEILEQMRQAAADEAQQAKDAPMAPIEAANPAAALSNRLIAQSDQRVEQLKSEADALSNALLEIAGPELDQRTLNTVKENQQRVQRQLAQVQENLERVARHETRVGRVEMGEKFAAAAERVQELSQQQVQEADNQSSAALKTLDSQRLATRAELGKGVQQAVESAQRALESQADALAAQIANRIANGDSAEGESGTSESTSAKKAMTLDDLDRALHGSPPSSAPGASSEEDGTAGGQLKPLPERSLDASPTLAAEREMAQRNAARQIMQMAEGETNELGESSEVTSTVSGSAVAGTPRQGELDGNGLNRETTGSSKAKDDWWRLREQKTEDVIEGKQRVISESYRKQIEAYFRGIAERSQP